MQDGKETKLLNLTSVFLVILAGMYRFIIRRTNLIEISGVIFSLITAAISIWLFQLQKRLTQPQIRKNLISSAYLMILWMVLRTLKYEFTAEGSTAARYVWYLYYLPMLFIPLLVFLATLAIGRPQSRPISRKWYLLFIPASLIFIGVLTNDFHQKAFLFCNGLEFWDNSGYSYGFIYFASQIWIAVMVIGMMTVALVRCVVLNKRRKIWIPLIPLLFGVIYTAGVVAGYESKFAQFLTVPEACCFVYAAFIETLIIIGLIPCNDNYGNLWNMSSIGAGIMSNGGEIVYKSRQSVPVTAEQVFRAEKENVLLGDGNISLCSHKINAGYGYWTKDISELNRLNKELENLGNVRAEENAMLDAENKIREKSLFLKRQNKLYDDMSRNVEKQLNELNLLLANAPENEEEFERNMKYACIPMVYIKLRSNLFLMSNGGKRVIFDELRLAISDSLEYANLCGIKTYCAFNAKGVYSGETILAAYDVFETAVEYAVPDTDAIFVNVRDNGGNLTVHIDINVPRRDISESDVKNCIGPTGGKIAIEKDEQTEIITLTFPGGGDGI